MSVKYPCPAFVPDAAKYKSWLAGKAASLRRRDRKRDTAKTLEAYKGAVHDAVVASGGIDAYTGEPLDWHLIGTYDNATSKAQRRAYKATLALLPTVDHVTG